jgi:hypothetical protein
MTDVFIARAEEKRRKKKIIKKKLFSLSKPSKDLFFNLFVYLGGNEKGVSINDVVKVA